MILTEALKRLTRQCKVVIYTESNFVTAGYNLGWLKKWKENGWKTAKGKDISNKEEWIQLDEELKKHSFEFKVQEEHSYKSWLRSQVERKEE